ncbi:DUF4145 domain-containing protein [Peribacillus frigoritolerans]|uniref:DUF4145 domain-containing protein n=1 Tax=Peribacillus frigoritolerans TaxID=450367 RepID=UPI003CFC335E
MTIKLDGSWQNTINTSGISFKCGYCGSNTAPVKGYFSANFNAQKFGHIYICPNCNKPTFIYKQTGEQIPGIFIGDEIEHLPENIEQLYNEARRCLSVNASTSTVLSCRKLLMNISVTKGAEEGKSFAFYVSYLEDNHFIPPGSKEWVDHIRKKGNEATHEIPSIDKADAIELLEFTEMLLRFVYEMPGKMIKHRS